MRDSNPWPLQCDCSALPAELHPHAEKRVYQVLEWNVGPGVGGGLGTGEKTVEVRA